MSEVIEIEIVDQAVEEITITDPETIEIEITDQVVEITFQETS